MNRRVKTFGGIIILICVILAGFAFFFPTPHYTISQAYGAPSGFAYAVAYGDNALVYSNGDTFIDYNYVTGQSQTLSPGQSDLKNVDILSVSADKRYLLFHDGYVSANGTLAGILQQHGLDPALDYWWIYNIQNQTFLPLPRAVLTAKLDGDNVDALIKATNNETIVTYTASSLQQTASINIPGSSNFFPFQGGFLLQTPDNTILLTKDGVVNKQLFTATTLIGITADGQQAAGVLSQNNVNKLVRLNLQNDSQKVIATKLSSQPVWLDTEEVLYTTASGNISQFSSYDFSTHKNTMWKFSGSADKINGLSPSPVALVGPTTMLVKDSSSNIYLVGSNPHPIQP